MPNSASIETYLATEGYQAFRKARRDDAGRRSSTK